MWYRIFAITLPLLGLPLLGCEKPMAGGLNAASLEEKATDRAKTEKAAKNEKPSIPVKERDGNKTLENPAGEMQAASLKDSTERYRFRWSDEKESDLPLIIEMKPVLVPEEIQGPFPADAPWRTEKKSAEKKALEKKTKKSIWPWN
jgi:hypothetical protein